MPIGAITPGSFVTVTPDASPSLYASVQAPTATMFVVGAHLQALTLVVLNIQDALEAKKLDLAGGTMTGAITLDNSASCLVVPSPGTIQVQSGAAITIANGALILVDGLVRFENATSELRVDAASAANFNGTATFNGTTKLFGRTLHRAPQRPADAATITVGPAEGEVVQLPVPGASGRVVKLRTTTAPVPLEGERMLVVLPPNQGDGLAWTVKREDGTAIVDLYTDTYPANPVTGGVPSWALCQFESGVWRGVMTGGTVECLVGW